MNKSTFPCFFFLVFTCCRWDFQFVLSHECPGIQSILLLPFLMKSSAFRLNGQPESRRKGLRLPTLLVHLRVETRNQSMVRRCWNCLWSHILAGGSLCFQTCPWNHYPPLGTTVHRKQPVLSERPIKNRLVQPPLSHCTEKRWEKQTHMW